MKYTTEQKNEYFRGLRAKWKESKVMADKDEKAKALFHETGGKFSFISFYMVLKSMQSLGLEGLPYIDCKTFNGWKEVGFKVRKGEKSKLEGIVWLHPITKNELGEEEELDESIYPKIYHLFHKSQIEPIKEKGGE